MVTKEGKLSKENKDNLELIQAIKEVCKEKGIDEEKLFCAIEDAIKAGYKKKYGENDNVEVKIGRDNGRIQVNVVYTVVEGEPKQGEISLEVARESDPDFQVGDIITREVESEEFGRMAALTGKQVVVQRIREAEQDYVNEYFREHQGTAVNALVQRVENGTAFLNLGRVDGVLLRSEQIPGEHYDMHSRIKVYVVDIRRTRLGAQIMVSRTHPGLLRKLFELEVPEIANGTVELKSAAREPGSRSKISVACGDKEIDAVGACVGPRGSRVQNIVNELNGEKIDIVAYSDNPAEYVANALSPSKVVEANANEDEKVCKVVVPDYQLSLAIGKEGQNARLAAKLTGWKIDIKSESQAAEGAEGDAAEETEKTEQVEAAEQAEEVKQAEEQETQSEETQKDE